MKNLKKPENFLFPFDNDIQIPTTETKDVSEVCKDHLKLQKEMNLSGDKHLAASEAKHFPKWKKAERKPLSFIEEIWNKRRAFLQLLNLPRTELANPTLGKVRMNYIFIFLGIISEVFNYFTACTYGFSMPAFEAVIVALAVVIFTKVMFWGMSKYIFDWIKTQNAFKRNFQKWLYGVICISILLNGLFFVVPRIDKLQDDQKYSQIEMINNDLEDLAEIKEKTKADNDEIASLEAQKEDLEKSLQAEDSGFMWFAKFMGLALLCILTVVCAAILYGITNYYQSAYKIKAEMDQLEESIALDRARIDDYPRTAQIMTRIKRELIRNWGQLQYLENLISLLFKK